MWLPTSDSHRPLDPAVTLRAAPRASRIASYRYSLGRTSMRPRRPARVGALAGMLISIGLGMAGASPLPVIAATALPNHVYSPYFETWTSDSIATTASQSGAKYLTLAFLETLGKNSCTLAWNGVSSQTV